MHLGIKIGLGVWFLWKFLRDPAGFLIGLIRGVIHYLVSWIEMIPVVIVLTIILVPIFMIFHVSAQQIHAWTEHVRAIERYITNW